MVKKENPGIRGIRNALHKPGDPEFMLYTIGQPMLVTFKDNSRLVGYYSGDNQSVIKIGFINTPHGIFFNLRDFFANSYVKKTRKLIEETSQDGFPGYGCDSDNVGDVVRRILAEHSPERPIVEVSYVDADLIGFLGENSDGETINLAHNIDRKGKYDEWLNKKFLDGRDFYERDHLKIPQPTLDGVISISVLKPENIRSKKIRKK